VDSASSPESDFLALDSFPRSAALAEILFSRSASVEPLEDPLEMRSLLAESSSSLSAELHKSPEKEQVRVP
jgi:hypothetical protein